MREDTVSKPSRLSPLTIKTLREVASRLGCDIVKVYKDHGISGAKGRDKRPGLDRLLTR